MSFDRLGRFVVRRRWWIVAAWAVLLLAALPFAPQAPGALSAGGFILDDLESARAKQLLQDELGVEPSAFVLVYTSDTLTAGSPEWLAAVGEATRDVAAAPHVTRVLSHVLAPRQVSADGHTAYDIVFLDIPPDDSPDAIPPVEAALREVPGLTVRIAGGPAFYGDVQEVTEQDLRRSELVSLPLAALALLLVFGCLVAAGVPLAVGGASVLVALAGIYVVASFVPMSIFVLNLATLLGLGLGVDYSLLMTSRFREELAHRDGPDRVAEAVRVTVATAGRAVFFSGPDGAAGPAGPRPVRVHDPALGRASPGRSWSGSRWPRRSRCCRRSSRSSGPNLDRWTRPPRRGRARRADGAWARLARRVMRRPGRRARPDARAAARARAAVPARPVQRPGRDDPAGLGAVARVVRPARPRVRRGRVRADRRRGPDDRATRRPPRTSPRSTPSRGGSRRTRGSAASTASSTSTRA